MLLVRGGCAWAEAGCDGFVNDLRLIFLLPSGGLSLLGRLTSLLGASGVCQRERERGREGGEGGSEEGVRREGVRE